MWSIFLVTLVSILVIFVKRKTYQSTNSQWIQILLIWIQVPCYAFQFHEFVESSTNLSLWLDQCAFLSCLFIFFKSNFNQKPKYYFICKCVWLASTPYRKFIPFPYGADTILTPCLKSKEIWQTHTGRRPNVNRMQRVWEPKLVWLCLFISTRPLLCTSKLKWAEKESNNKALYSCDAM